MGMDSAAIRALCSELSLRLIGAKVKAFLQIDPWEFIVRTNQGDLVVSCHPRFKRIVYARSVNQPIGTHFARTGESLFRHAVLSSISQRRLDRIVEVGFRRGDSLSEDTFSSIVIEFIGNSGNAIIVTSGSRVIATLRRSRRNVAGKTYRPPREPSWVDPGSLTEEELVELIEKGKASGVAGRIVESIMGFGPLLAREVVHRAGLDPEVTAESCTRVDLAKVAAEVLRLHEDLMAQRFSPAVYYRDDDPVEFSCFALSHLGGLVENRFESMNDAVIQFHRSAVESERLEEKKRVLLRSLRSRIRRARTRLAKQAEELDEAREGEKYKVQGDAILANLPSIRKATSRALLENPHEPGCTVEVEFLPDRSPQEMAQEYFKKYKKMKKALPVLKKKLTESRRSLTAIETLNDELEGAVTSDKINRLTEDLISRGIVQRPGSRKAKARKQYRVFVTSNGWEVIVGRSQKENDEITFREAKPRDLFFHVSSAPGSHTIMRVEGKGRTPGRKDIEEVAEIAAFYSKARTSKVVPVAYAERRYVRKPRKAPPGTVIVEREKVVMVEPRKPH